MKAIFLLVSIAFVAALPRDEFQHHINKVNSIKTTWKAGHNFDDGVTLKDVQRMCGALSNPTIRASLTDGKNFLVFLLYMFNQLIKN